jgi:hypothetical protein
MTFGEAVRLPALQALIDEGVPRETVKKLSKVPAIPLEDALEQNNAGALVQVLASAGLTPGEMPQLGGIFSSILKTLAAFQSHLPTMPTPPPTATPVLPQPLKRGGAVEKNKDRKPKPHGHELLAKKRAHLRQVFTQNYRRGFLLGQVKRAKDALKKSPLARGGLTDQAPERLLSGGSLSKWGKPHPHRGGAHLIHSTTPGRTDRIRTKARPGSFVVPADVVSGIGQGNTLAGAKIFGDLISSGPYGTKQPKMATGRLTAPPTAKVPNMPSMKMPRVGSMKLKTPPKLKGFMDGGSYGAPEEEATPIITAGGEMILEPEVVEAYGGGDADAGHKSLRNMVLTVRKQVIRQLQQLPGPIQ